MTQPILQFGTSRFLQAHVDLFVSQALDRGATGKALGGITVVQTTGNPASAERLTALAAGEGYPVRIRGLRNGKRVEQDLVCRAVKQAWHADASWPALREAMESGVRVIVSNTADRGYQLDNTDGPALVNETAHAPRGFPAKLLVLLHQRWQTVPAADLSIFPCELIERNGDVLRGIVCGLAAQWKLDPTFIAWLGEHCVWANSLVDRIVSQALHPVGAVAEPYALWAIERHPRLMLPCVHEDILLTDDLQRYERLKLFLLNAGHTLLAERWLAGGRAPDETVQQAMNDGGLRVELESFWADEVLPVFDALGQHGEARAYLVDLRERLLNPFLDHRISDIAQNHAQKKQRRFAPIVALAAELQCGVAQLRLRAALASGA
ncbi:mannitol dehydrogenase family protein [Ramlibacter sp. WS9]|uniref:mannitol dehydrogenase family protein n=1 Tax=Ramlibacter sp. WS9 TaxID=1882741 RepID=UPI001143D740|nr:mannitol dehydrogenase family protein [Ramlibacter sp. WS9]ROZ77622.1 mannitol dehydrogenase family protein [Ramlibacter sp. WS9]